MLSAPWCDMPAAGASGGRSPRCLFSSEHFTERFLSLAWFCLQEPGNFLQQKCLRLKAALSVFAKRYPEWKCKSVRADLMYI